jgi:hypothetical protein
MSRMKQSKILLLIGSVTLLAAVGLIARPSRQITEQAIDSSIVTEDFKICISTRQNPLGQWLTLVPWDEVKDVERFDEIQPLCTPKRVLIITGGKCAVISRKTFRSRVQPQLEALDQNAKAASDTAETDGH